MLQSASTRAPTPARCERLSFCFGLPQRRVEQRDLPAPTEKSRGVSGCVEGLLIYEQLPVDSEDYHEETEDRSCSI